MIVAIVILLILSALADAFMYVLQFRVMPGSRFYQHPWWDPDLSWSNKYKNNDPKQGEKFPGSTTLFVAVTDGWHFIKFLRDVFTSATLAVAMSIFSTKLSQAYGLVFWFVLIYALQSLIFHLFFSSFSSPNRTSMDNLKSLGRAVFSSTTFFICIGTGALLFFFAIGLSEIHPAMDWVVAGIGIIAWSYAIYRIVRNFIGRKPPKDNPPH